MNLKRFLFFLVGLVIGIIIPTQIKAAVLTKDYSSLLSVSKVCYCFDAVKSCSVMVTPSGFDYLGGNCPADLRYLGEKQDLLNKVQGGSSNCGGVTQATWEGGSLYAGSIINFSCHVPTFEQKCLCQNGTLDKETNEMVYSCGIQKISDNEYPDTYKTFETIPADCPATFRISLDASSYCCCKDTGVGSLTQNKECRRIEGKGNACNSAIFEGHADLNSAATSETGYQGQPIDKDGGCNTYTKTTASYTGAASVGLSDLKNEAAAALNPMKFGLRTAGVNNLIGRFIYGLTFLIGSMLLLFYVYAGILWMTAAGNSEKAGKAKQIFVWSTLGVVVVLASYMIVSFVFNFAG